MMSNEISDITLKDLFYLVGIIVTLFLGIKNISILNTNRRNSLRESIYKEQLNFMMKLSDELIKLNRSLTFLHNNVGVVTIESKKELTEQILTIHEVVMTNSVICSDTIIEMVIIILEKANIYINDKYENKISDQKKFDNFFSSFTDIILEFKRELGIQELKKENNLLFTKRKEIFKF